MEYELFRSKLKPFVDRASVSGTIRNSSSGLNSHRTAVMELIIEGSIRERRKRMFAEVENSFRSDPTPQVKMTSEAPNMPIPEVQLPLPVPAPQPPPQTLPNDATGIVTSPASASTKYNASPDSPALSGPNKKKKGVARSERPPADVKANPSPLNPEDFVMELECEDCHFKRSRRYLQDGVECGRLLCHLAGRGSMRCVGCGTTRVDNTDACTGCHRTFK